MKAPEDMTRDELIGAVRAYRKALGLTVDVPQSYGEFLSLSEKDKMKLLGPKSARGK